MRVNGACKLQLAGAVLLATLLSSCLQPQRVPQTAPPPAAATAPLPPPARPGLPYDIVADESLLIVLAYRGGPLASAGHNHLIASHALAGSFHVPADVLQSTFEVRIPVATLSVDEPTLRAHEDPGSFAPDVPDGARQGTRRNMLGPALLNAERDPEIVLRSLSIVPAAVPGAVGEAEGSVLATIESTVAGTVRTVRVPVHYRLAAATLEASGDMPLRQSDLGLTPFSALLGALVVQDEMHVRFHIIARVGAGAAPQ